MSFITIINQIADGFEEQISSVDGIEYIPTDDYGWTNHRWKSNKFRLAHVERFVQPKFCVLHTVIFPHINDPSPIFGFDIVASDTKATGLFFDLSPTIEDWGKFCSRDWSEPRERPDWGTIFSEHWVACRPTLDETQQIGKNAQEVLGEYLEKLGKTSNDVDTIKFLQNTYSLQQRKNEHTTKVLKNILGNDIGTYFIENILFPIIL